MNSRRELGVRGEELAAQWAKAHGYTVLERNWRGRRGELDLVLTRGNLIVIVEVRTRRSRRFGSGEESVDGRKRLQVRRVAEEYLLRRGWMEREVRFDVLSIDWNGTTPVLRHIPGAF